MGCSHGISGGRSPSSARHAVLEGDRRVATFVDRSDAEVFAASRPGLRLEEPVASQAPSEMERQAVRQNLEWSTRELAANLLRVIRGAGKGYELPRQAATFLNTLLAYDQMPGLPLSAGIVAETTLRRVAWETSGGAAADAKDTICSGALQVVASRFMGQRTQECAGEDQMHQGIIWREEERQRQRQAVLGGRPPRG